MTIGSVEFQWDNLVVISDHPVASLAHLAGDLDEAGEGDARYLQDIAAPAMVGSTSTRRSVTFALAGGLAGAAGLIHVLQFTTIRFDTRFQLGLIAFTAAVLGGISNLAARCSARS